jgi:DNA-binding NarL/FixJ family response regulator
MNSACPIRVVLADDHQLFRRGLRHLLELEPDIVVVAEAANGAEALEHLATHQAEILLLDMVMPVMDGLATLAALRQRQSTVPVLVLSMNGEEATVLRSIAAGADGFIRKDAAADEVIHAIRALAGGHTWLEPRAASVLVAEYRRLHALAGRATTGRLSERDLALLRLLAGGHSNKEIASALHIAESTVKNQLGQLFGRLGVSDRTQAALYAFAHGILPADPSEVRIPG